MTVLARHFTHLLGLALLWVTELGRDLTDKDQPVDARSLGRRLFRWKHRIALWHSADGNGGPTEAATELIKRVRCAALGFNSKPARPRCDLWPYPPPVPEHMLESRPEHFGHEEEFAMMFWSDSHWVFWQVALMWVGMIAFWGLIIWAVYAMFGGDKQVPQHEHRNDDVTHILDGRLARGEIDTEEYARLRSVIQGSGRTSVGAGANR